MSKPLYSLARALSIINDERHGGANFPGLEGECHQELVRSIKPKSPSSLLVPLAALSREVTAQTFTQGGALVDEVVPSVSAALRPNSVVLSAGATVVQQPRNMRIPNITSGMALHWLGESECAPESSLEFGQLNLTPKRLAGWLTISNQLLSQAPAIADTVIARDMRAAVGSAIDLAACSGLGFTGEPLGLLNNPAVPATITFGGSPVIGDFTAAEKTIADAGAEELGSLAFITSPASRKKLRETERAAGNGFIWTDADEIIGKRAFASPNVTDDLLIYGSWSDLLIVLFTAIEVTRDMFTEKKTARSNIHVDLLADLGPMRPLAFVKSSNSP